MPAAELPDKLLSVGTYSYDVLAVRRNHGVHYLLVMFTQGENRYPCVRVPEDRSPVLACADGALSVAGECDAHNPVEVSGKTMK